ncbi:hypothetical protein BH10PSE17_BH10PSE17_03370 [soil metagenome]
MDRALGENIKRAADTVVQYGQLIAFALLFVVACLGYFLSRMEIVPEALLQQERVTPIYVGEVTLMRYATTITSQYETAIKAGMGIALANTMETNHLQRQAGGDIVLLFAKELQLTSKQVRELEIREGRSYDIRLANGRIATLGETGRPLISYTDYAEAVAGLRLQYILWMVVAATTAAGLWAAAMRRDNRSPSVQAPSSRP